MRTGLEDRMKRERELRAPEGACPVCGSPPGETCRSLKTNHPTDTHGPRLAMRRAGGMETR